MAEAHAQLAQPAQTTPNTNGVTPYPNDPTAQTNGTSTTEVEITCGPLLNYRHTTDADSKPVWHGSVLIVAKPGATAQPRLQYRESPAGVLLQDEHATNANSTNGTTNGTTNGAEAGGPLGGSIPAEWLSVQGLKLYADPRKTFWRFDVDVPLGSQEARWEYTLENAHLAYESSVSSTTRSFVVPAASESMRIMFHSCNGFSVGTDEDDWCGPVLWRDVLRVHAQKPIHVMIGGGDQIYNDNVRVDGPLRRWTDIGNPVKRREYAFGETLRAECDQFYFDNYVRWYSTEPFATANGQIAQINIWDDHGKYPE